MATASEVGEFAKEHGSTVAVAESLTGGDIATADLLLTDAGS